MENMTYSVVKVFQFVLFLLAFTLIYRTYQLKTTRKQRILLMASIAAGLNSYGYFEALMTMTEQGSRWAMRPQYVTAVLYMAYMLSMILQLCDFSLNKVLNNIFWGFNGIFIVLLSVDAGLGVLFYDFSFSNNLLSAQLRFSCTPLGYILMAFEICVIAAMLYIGIIIRADKGKDMIISVVSVFAALPGLGYVLNLAGLTGGYDTQSLLMVLACFVMYRADKTYHILDDGRIAKETILGEIAEGYIILDNNRGVRAYNSIAALLYPELENPKEQEVIVELIYLHNHDVIEHNGKICNVIVSELEENGDRTGFVMWLYDCTDEYYYMRELEKVKKRANELDQIRNLFLNHMTHGFGSPLHIIKDRADAIYEDERSSDDAREMTLEIFEAGQKLQDMVSVMMNYMDTDDIELPCEAEYSTDQLVRLLGSMLESHRQGRCKKVELCTDPKVPSVWYGSLDGIERAFQAVFCCVGIVSKITGIRMQIDAQTRYADTLLSVTLYLEDNGALTGEFNRLEVLKQKDAMALGERVDYIPYLYCMKLLTQLKGSLSCSLEGMRSRICLMFPERVVDATHYGEHKDLIEELGPKADANGDRVYTVMVVDDNLIYLREMDGWLRELGLKTIMAKSGAECLRILERKQVDLIFMDQMMPQMEGTEVFAKLREMEQSKHQKPVPVVLLTADDTTGARKKYLSLGFDNYLPKPIEKPRICEEVKRYLPI